MSRQGPFHCEEIHHMIGRKTLLPSPNITQHISRKCFLLSLVLTLGGFCTSVRWFFITVHTGCTVILSRVLWAPQLQQLQSGLLLTIPVDRELARKGRLAGRLLVIDIRDELQPVASLRALVPEDGVIVWDLMRTGQVHSAAVLLSQHGCWGLDHLVLRRRCYTRRYMMLYLTLKKLDFTDNSV